MRTTILLLCVATAASVAGQTASTSTAPEAGAATQKDSALVKAAKASGGAKKPLPKKPITNADVKKSSGKIVELPPDGTPASPPAGAPASTLAIYEAKNKALAATQKRVADNEAKVAALEKDLARIEQSYYEAADPNYRDTTIALRFDQTKKQLDAARKELADAREALAPLLPKSQ